MKDLFKYMIVPHTSDSTWIDEWTGWPASPTINWMHTVPNSWENPVNTTVYTDTSMTIEIELPGCKDIRVVCDESNKITVSGKTRTDKLFASTGYSANNYNLDTIEATYKDGVLYITLQKSKSLTNKQIEVKLG